MAMEPQAAKPSPAPAVAGEGGAPPAEGGGDIMEFVSNVAGALNTLATGMAQNKSVPPEISQRLQAVYDEFTSIFEDLAGGGAPQPAAAGNTTQEQGGSKAARPLPPGA